VVKEVKKSKLTTIIIILVGLALLSFILSAFVGVILGDIESGNVALIKVEGPIITTNTGFFGSGFAVSEDIVELIKEADDNPAVKAIIIEINSPGGSAVASDEVGRAIKKTNKTTVAVIRDVGASGGYWVASSTDHIIANRMSITGSIGALMSYLEFSGFIERYNISHERLVAGKYKDIGSPLRPLSTEERTILQGFLDDVHDEFIKEVAENRGLSFEDVEKMATGLFYTGSKAKDLGLVDELGGKDEATAYIENNLNITVDISEYKKSVGFSDLFSEMMGSQSFSIGEGIGSAMFSDRTPGMIS